MALSGTQITRNAVGGAGRAYAGFVAKAETVIEEAVPAGGGKGRRRYQFVVIEGRQILVNSPQEAAMLLSKARKAKQEVRKEAKKEKRNLIKLKKPDATTGAIDWNAKQEAELKALLQEMYDEEETLVALLCLH